MQGLIESEITGVGVLGGIFANETMEGFRQIVMKVKYMSMGIGG